LQHKKLTVSIIQSSDFLTASPDSPITAHISFSISGTDSIWPLGKRKQMKTYTGSHIKILL
jgi:hypothetical protein